VLSFLRTEGDAYDRVTARAGEYAADWTVNNISGFERRVILSLPAGLRTRAGLRTARHLVRATYPGSRAIVKVKRGRASIDLRGSLFCEVRETSILPLCGFYASATRRVMQLFALDAAARVSECRAAGGRKGCLLSVVVNGESVEQPAVA
jgi:hypothetical protein